MVKWYFCAFCQPEFEELFSMEICFWLLQQQLNRDTVFLGQEGEWWMPYRPPTIENYPPWDNFSLKRGWEKLDWVLWPPNCGFEQGQENSASLWILDVLLHVLNGSAAVLASSSYRCPHPTSIIPIVLFQYSSLELLPSSLTLADTCVFHVLFWPFLLPRSMASWLFFQTVEVTALSSRRECQTQDRLSI